MILRIVNGTALLVILAFATAQVVPLSSDEVLMSVGAADCPGGPSMCSGTSTKACGGPAPCPMSSYSFCTGPASDFCGTPGTTTCATGCTGTGCKCGQI